MANNNMTTTQLRALRGLLDDKPTSGDATTSKKVLSLERVKAWPIPKQKKDRAALKEAEEANLRAMDEAMRKEKEQAHMDAIMAARKLLLESTPEARTQCVAMEREAMLRVRARQIEIASAQRAAAAGLRKSEDARIIEDSAAWATEMVVLKERERANATHVALDQREQLSSYIDAKRKSLQQQLEEEKAEVARLTNEAAEAQRLETARRSEQQQRNDATRVANRELMETRISAAAAAESEENARLQAYADERDRLAAFRESERAARTAAATARANAIASAVADHFKALMDSEDRRVGDAVSKQTSTCQRVQGLVSASFTQHEHTYTYIHE